MHVDNSVVFIKTKVHIVLEIRRLILSWPLKQDSIENTIGHVVIFVYRLSNGWILKCMFSCFILSVANHVSYLFVRSLTKNVSFF